MTMGITEYKPAEPITNPNAADFVPKYLHTGYADPSGKPDVHIRDDFYGTRRKMRIGVLGAGISAITFLHFAEKRLKDVEIVVYERNEDVGGVWFTSRYPGCRCDIPSVVYQFPWRPNIWSEMYAPAAENLAYIQTVARENNFYKYIKLRHEILQAAWTDEEAKWTLKVRDLNDGSEFEDKVDVFVEFNGPVSNPRITSIAGIENFKGKVVHPAYWTDDIDLENKRVALIGYGCSGVQIAPNIIDRVDKLYTWFRNKTYILPPPNQAFSAAEGANFKYSEEQKSLLKDPDVYLAYRKSIDDGFHKRYPYIVNGSPMSNQVHSTVTAYMREKLSTKPSLLSSIMPSDFSIGCRRQTFAYGYLEALTSPKTTVFETTPKGFTETGILASDDQEHPIDIVIAATGYDQSHLPRFPKLVNGTSVLAQWATPTSPPPSYMALMLRRTPNYFNPSSAYGPLPQGNFYQSAEAFSQYIVATIRKMQTDRVVAIHPKDAAVAHFARHAAAWLRRTAMTGPCVSWYKGNNATGTLADGAQHPPAVWPGGRSQFVKVMETPRFEDFEIRYEDPHDMFAFMGNGWAGEVEGEEGGDRTWYMGVPGKEVDEQVLERLRGVYAGVGGDGEDGGREEGVEVSGTPDSASASASAPVVVAVE